MKPPEHPSALAIVLAAGKGTRMNSELPKVLVPVCGRPMIGYVLDAVRAAGIPRVVVVIGYRGDLVREELVGEPGVEFVEQQEQRGTGHAVMMCREQLADHEGPVLVVAGDSPMLQAASVGKLLEVYQADAPACVIGTVERADPTGYGRILRGAEGDFIGIVEEKDATDSQRAMNEVNVSTYVFNPTDLLATFDQLTNQNAQGEYYLTDCPALLLGSGKPVTAQKVLKSVESLSINSMAELAEVEETIGQMMTGGEPPPA